MSVHKSQTSKPSIIESVPTRSARNVVVNRASVDPADGLATSADLAILRAAEVPPAAVKNPSRGLGDAFTPAVVGVLTGNVVPGYFGSRVNISAMVAAAARFAKLDAVRTRLDNSANLTAQISAPDGELVASEMSKMMRTWADFENAHPKEALALESLRAEWSSAHPGRPPVKKEKQSKTEKDAAKSTNVVASEPGPPKS